MKIGILTFVNTTNYGASLQAFSLQQTIISKGHECEIIRYYNEKIVSMHDPRTVFANKGVKLLIAPILYFVYKKRKGKFDKFENANCIFSQSYNRETIREINNKYDRIIVGSDQVWNTELTGNDKAYFLDFMEDDQKKYSYAASVGTGYFLNNAKEYEDLINHFQIISVRERNTARRLMQHLGKENVTCDIDPTFLLHDKWRNYITKESKLQKENYIFMYLSPDKEELYNAVRCFAKKMNCKIILLKKGIGKRKGIDVLNTASPIDFINYIYYARYVIAGSFHAISFAIMLEKQFYITSAINKKRNDRLSNLVELFGVKDRIIFEPEYRFSEKEIEFNSIRNKIIDYVKESNKTIDMICG